MTTEDRWSEESLHRIGFEGFTSLSSAVGLAPSRPGTYVVIRSSASDADFTPESCGGWFKRRDPAVSLEVLRGKWVPGAKVVYIGQGGDLKRRLSQLKKFGDGKPIGHWGGRYLWQLADCDRLLVAWREDSEPREGEAALLERFVSDYGRLPFANLQ